ncbi:CXXC-20-CXXC protein [Sedimentibacter acidaminivorans]|uniref:CXXC-20-CXXC protein n=1 Tax=Sedimentibacter acidaminivorans TaxID=913099 RepID=A0ABS4GBN3_9FIRM|nr:TIGR04104 family putative zinc finger protein [Sedimentibacter acidaminivorans]MBP1925100.1 CXXC-20-CXXC protein [Sedimentibacter acidaminivorans]
MQKCKECSNKFRYKDIIKSIWLKGYAPITCAYCDTINYVNISTRLILSLSISLPLIINVFVNLFFDYFYNLSYFSIILYLFWVSIIIGVTPFYARYHTKSNVEPDDGTKALLASKLNRAEAEIVISILESYGIPYLKKSNETKKTIEIYAEYSNHKIDIYVPPNMIQMSRELTNHY